MCEGGWVGGGGAGGALTICGSLSHNIIIILIMLLVLLFPCCVNCFYPKGRGESKMSSSVFGSSVPNATIL